MTTRPIALICAALLASSGALAADYGTFVDIETEEDLLDLLESQEISEETYETLVELLHDGVDLNSADRGELYSLPNLTRADVDAILSYRSEAGRIGDPASLVTAGALSERKLASISPYLIVSTPAELPLGLRGRLRYRTTWVAGPEIPAMWLGADASALREIDVGAMAVLTRNRVADVRHDPSPWRDALSAREPSPQLHLPKFYVVWEADRWHVVGGTYRIGFGQRLTFDNTAAYEPNGIKIDRTLRYNQDLSRSCKESRGELETGPCAGEARYAYLAPDYAWTDRLRGVAAGFRDLELGSASVQSYAFLSYQTKSIYQYEIYDRRSCDDPQNDDDPDCRAPAVFRRQDDPLARTSRLNYHSLPDLYNELVAGTNATIFFPGRAHLGLTAYGADIQWLVEGMELDFQEWSRTPYGGPFGAIGVNGAWGHGWIDFAAEAAKSFDAQPEGGGLAGILRATATISAHEVEAALRYYETSYANPYARPISEPDEFDGLRARDETGLRLRYVGGLGDLELRTTADLWLQPSRWSPKGLLKVRADYKVTSWLRPGLWIGFTDRDLAATGRDNCYEGTDEEVEGEPEPCHGERWVAGGQLRFSPLRELGVTAKYQHELLDDPRESYADGFRQDLSAWLVVAYRPMEWLRLRARGRYLYEGIDDNSYLEQSLRLYLEASYWFERLFQVKVRYELNAWLDERESTQQREPSPAHWVRLELEYRF